MLKSFVLDLHGEWSEVADECICLLTTVQRRAHVRLADFTSMWNVDLMSIELFRGRHRTSP
jgi:hypothetical protein